MKHWSVFFGWIATVFVIFSHASIVLARTRLPFQWEEVRTKSFAVIYPNIEGVEKETILHLYQSVLPPDQRDLGHVILVAYGDILEKEYQRATSLFGTELELPISVRVYPKEKDFILLNSYAPQITPGATHSHIGEVEISLIVENIIKNPLKWESEALNAFRYEMSALSIEKLSKGKAPPALVESISYYLLDPSEVVGPLLSEVDKTSFTDTSLVELWGKSNLDRNPTEMVSSISVIALLVDQFGWQKVLTLLQTIPTTTDVVSAFETTFNMSLDEDFKELWLVYYPFYIQSRWQTHFLYDIDEDSYRLLIQSGAYTDAKHRIEEHIHLLEKVGDAQKAQNLRDLYEIATLGQQGLSLLQEARQDYIAGNTEASLEKLVEAKSIFHAIRDDQRISEVETIRESILQAQSIQEELDRKKWVALLSMSRQQMEHLNQLISKLIRLGNQQNSAQIQTLIELTKIRSMAMTILAMVFLSLFSYRRLRAWVKKLDQEPYL